MSSSSTRSNTSSTRVMASRESPVQSHSETVADLTHSSNMFAAGVGEIIHAFLTTANRPSDRPIMVEYANRVMAVGRARLATMSGRNALMYMRGKFGLLNTTSAVFLQATFEQDGVKFVEVDLDSWEELVGFIYKLRVIH